MFRSTKRRGNLIWLSLKDYFNEWQMSGCFILALAAVLAPMMVLFGLKVGIIGSMVDGLVQDPRNLEIRLVGSGRYFPSWFDNMRKRSDVAFVIPRTRSLAATIQLKSNNAPRILRVEMIPSGQGDPLLPRGRRIPNEFVQVVLSSSAARKLKVSAGDTVDGSLSRKFHGRSERKHRTLIVTRVAPPASFARDGVFVSLELMKAAEDFRDGRAVPSLGWSGDPQLPGNADRAYPGFRLYAKTIYDVEVLSETLAEQGIEVRTRAADISVVQNMDRNFSLIYWVIAIIGLVGFTFSLGSSIWANVDRKRRELSVLRLIGFRTGDIMLFPMLQAFFTGLFGWGLASLIYLGVEFVINTQLADSLQFRGTICQLMPEHYLGALIFTVCAATFAAALGGYHAARIEPSDGLREI
ncbi:ABC transporter permease [Pseudomonadota bacterium]